MKYAVCLITFSFLPGIAIGHSGYIGFSGAPGSNGTCTNSCHGQYDFVPGVTVTGFPELYEPGQQYEVSVGHTTGGVINQFNASVRIGTGSDNGGAISEGTNTATYSTSNETNGVRWSAADTDSGSFVWTAPEAGTGDVRLYWAGLQGTRANGADTQVVLVAHEQNTDVEYLPGTPSEFYLEQNYPNPFNDQTMVEISLAKSGQVHFIITNILGQLVFEWRQDIIQPGIVAIRWDGTGLNGNELPSGIYFYRLTSSAGTLTKKMMLLR
jgi:hypothetical protein